MDILLVGTYTQHDAPAVLEKQELGKGIYLIPYNEILGDVAGTPYHTNAESFLGLSGEEPAICGK